jgi:acetoin utilization protein AcuB
MEKEYVRDWMTPAAVTVHPETSLSEAYQLMQTHHVRRLPVTEGEWLVGMVTMKDLWAIFASPETQCNIFEMAARLDRLTVMHIMTHNVVTVTPDTPIKAACELMLTHQIGGLPVMVEGRLAGILTESDIFRLVAKHGLVYSNHV